MSPRRGATGERSHPVNKGKYIPRDCAGVTSCKTILFGHRGRITYRILCALIPLARRPFSRTDVLIAIFDATVALNCLMTAGFLLVGFSRSRLTAVLVLAAGYLFTSLITAAHMLTFVGLFQSGAPLGADIHPRMWLEAFRNGGFPFFIICYVELKRAESGGARPHTDNFSNIILVSCGAVAGVFLLTFLAVAG
jgi:hypothetical protein